MNEEEKVEPRISGVVEVMENLKQHEGWKILEAWLTKEIKYKEDTILNTIDEGDKIYTKLGAAKLERQRLTELLNKPNSIICDASQKTMWQQAIELDGENHSE